MKINFEKLRLTHQKTILAWLEEPHVKEFWDNSQAHKDDIDNFIRGRKEASKYVEGRYVYWIALLEDKPFGLIMTIKENMNEDRAQIKQDHLSKSGSTYSVDYMIGDKAYIGRGLGAATLEAFTLFFQKQVDEKADTFFIDPDESNPRARHVYEKAGFQYIGDFLMDGEGVFAGRKSHFLVKKLRSTLDIISATLADHPTVQNMARFYVYDMSRYCGFISKEWAIPANGLYESFDFKSYFEDSNRKAFLVKIFDELAGFVLINKMGTSNATHWNMGEFFILAKFQGQGVGQKVAQHIWEMLPGTWEVSVIPENTKALSFWRKAISNFKDGKYKEEIKIAGKDKQKRVILSFDTTHHSNTHHQD